MLRILLAVTVLVAALSVNAQASDEQSPEYPQFTTQDADSSEPDQDLLLSLAVASALRQRIFDDMYNYGVKMRKLK